MKFTSQMLSRERGLRFYGLYGSRADASEVEGQLEEIINEAAGRHPDLSLQIG